ncbi:MAG: MlaD family protein [Planctomycetota bacterium]
MNAYTKHELVTGTFVVIAAAIFTLFAFNILDLDLRLGSDVEPARFTAEFTDVGSLTVGDKVVFGGTEVGKVTAIQIKLVELGEDQAAALNLRGSQPPARAGQRAQVIEVGFEVDDPSLRLDPATASVFISRTGLLGRDTLALDPGRLTEDAQPIVELLAGDPMAYSISGQERLGFDGLLARAGPILSAAQSTLDNFNDRVLTDDNTDSIRAILTQVKSATARAEEFLTAAEETSVALRELTGDVQTRIDQGWPRTREAIESIAELAANLEAQVQRISDEAVEVLDVAEAMVNENRPELAEATRRLRRTLFEAELLARKVRSNPSILVFGDDDPLLDAELSDEAWLLRSGRAQPYLQRDERP